jgi:hypothetical protein
MATVPDGVATVLRRGRPEPDAGRPVATLVQDAPVRRAPDATAAPILADGLAVPAPAPARAATVVLVDEHGVPVGLEVDGTRVTGGRRPMCVMPGEDVAAVALRASGRPDAERLLPVVCCDELGRPIGVVPVDRLLEALARAATA